MFCPKFSHFLDLQPLQVAFPLLASILSGGVAAALRLGEVHGGLGLHVISMYRVMYYCRVHDVYPWISI